jgi:hypothetical protein
MDGRWFGEGLTRYSIDGVQQDGGQEEQQQLQPQFQRLIQITWMENVAFIYDAYTLQELQRIH